jgi:hypothetical protein
LLALRRRAVRGLLRQEQLDGGMIALLGSVTAALDALDSVPVRAARAERAVVADDGGPIRLITYQSDGVAVAIELDAARAINLAGRLIAAARRRF